MPASVLIFHVTSVEEVLRAPNASVPGELRRTSVCRNGISNRPSLSEWQMIRLSKCVFKVHSWLRGYERNKTKVVSQRTNPTFDAQRLQ